MANRLAQGVRIVAAAAVAAAALGFAAGAQAQQRPKVTLGLPGIPPVFVTVQAYTAQQQKLFEKYGVDVVLRPFDSGAAAARAVVSGDVEISLSPSPLIVNMISNANVDLVTIYGNEKPDWLLSSLDPAKTKCEQMKGQPIGVDSLGGARSIALQQMLFQCGLKAEDTQQVALGTNVHAAMSGGQLALGVLHVDDVPIIERASGKKLTTIIDINDVYKVNHYMAITTTRKRVAEQRDALVRVLAALIEAERFISDPKNIDAVAKIAAPTGRSEAEAKWAIPEYVKMGFWPKGAGLDKANIEAIIAQQKAVGGIRPNATPVTYERYADTSLFEDARKLVK
ncbi:MAG: ABC-type nitrate/sulfonate/bicarbonate transport system periplasmic component-like protein [Hyphomicrobiales bacterium]|nr:ABC-type nitrate/sulfonate/bicarbonate transport system periplasmic component-like protein [Hyphomicrobiales bacterium]